MTFGLTSQGFNRKALTDILADVQAAQRAAFGVGLKNTDAAFALTQLNTILMTPVAELWEVAEAVNNADDPDAAEGAALDALCALTGTTRLDPFQSIVTITCTGTPGTFLAAGRTVSVVGVGDKFTTTTSPTIGALAAHAFSTVYILGDRVTRSSRCYLCITPGTSAASGGPTTTAADIVDGTAHWRYLGEGTGTADAVALSVDFDAIQALSGSLTVIESPVGGWQSVVNILDATPGQADESDPALRVRRLNELAGSSTKTADAIRTAVERVSGVVACDVFANPTDFVDADGVPAHAVEVLVRGGADQDIRDSIFSKVDAATYTQGTTVGTSLDGKGVAQTVRFSRPTEVPIYVDVTITKIASKYPANGDTLVKAAIVAFGAAYPHGFDAYAAALIAPVFSVLGVLNLSLIAVGTAPSPVLSAVTIGSRQLATFDTSRINVFSSNGTP